MIIFELTMPNKGSWNGKWSGEKNRHIRIKSEKSIDKNIINKIIDKNYYYTWDDGWTACISIYKLPAKEARKLEKLSTGFYGYDWMITSILKYNKITKESIKD